MDENKRIFDWARLDGGSFQDLVVELLAREGFDARDQGIGPDGGIDILAIQNLTLQEGIYKSYTWAVQAKYRKNAKSTVKPSELGNIGNLLSRFKADGFLLVTSGRVTNKAFSEIRAISDGSPPNYLAAVWDNKLLEGKLLKHPDLARRYLESRTETSILLIDDDPAVLFANYEMLSAIGHRVYKASSPPEALKVARDRDIDIAIVDIRLDDAANRSGEAKILNGMDLAKEIRSIRPGVRIVYLTAYLASAEVAARAGLENAVFLSKFDTDAEKLRRLVNKTLGVPDEISTKAMQFESITTFVNARLHRVISKIHAARTLAELESNSGSRVEKIGELLGNSLASLKMVVKDLALERFQTTMNSFRWHSLMSILSDAVASSEASHTGARIRLRSLRTDCKALCERGDLRMAISNLIDNAVESGPEKQFVDVDVSASVIDRERRYARIAISDRGVGIEPEDIPGVYLPGVSTKGGSGMGFFLANKVAEFHGGWVEIMSPYRKWSTRVSVYIPLENAFLQREREESPLDQAALGRLAELGKALGNEVPIEIITLFLEDMPKRVAALDVGRRAGDCRRVESTAHAIKGSCNHIGALDAARIAQDIERDAEALRVESLPDKIGQLKEELARTKKSLQAFARTLGDMSADMHVIA